MPGKIKLPFLLACKNAPLKQGESIVINGNIPADSDNFIVQLICGKDKEKDDIAAKFDFVSKNDKGEKVTFTSSREKGNWEDEELKSERFPFTPGNTFELKINVLDTELSLDVDGKKYFSFDKRIDFKRITHVFIDGDILLSAINFL